MHYTYFKTVKLLLTQQERKKNCKLRKKEKKTVNLPLSFAFHCLKLTKLFKILEDMNSIFF